MDRNNKGPSLASPTQETGKPAPVPKLRRKLQKVKRPESGEVPNYKSTNRNKFDTPPRISLPTHLRPDLSDSKWSEYLRSSGYLGTTPLDNSSSPEPHKQRNSPTPPQDGDFSVKPPAANVPELSYLSSPASHDTPRSSVDSTSESSDASAASMRRRAKTPVFHIGQLEARARARKLEAANKRAAEMREAMDDACRLPARSHRSDPPKPMGGEPGSDGGNVTLRQTNTEEVSTGNMTLRETNIKGVIIDDASRTPQAKASIQERRVSTTAELTVTSESSKINHIAESYRALIGAEDPSRFIDSRPETPYSFSPGREVLTIRHKRRSGDLRRDSQTFEHAAEDELPQSSPAASDGTLVAFDEETIYFKPMSPLSPKMENESPAGVMPSPTPNNIGLKICVDLLGKDLASAVTRTEQLEDPPESAALQIWTMIEAYEKLRDRVMDIGLRYDEVLSLQQSIETWLGGLYAAHERLTGTDSGREQ
ncbi:hypothetical protein GE09DRAFT_1050002 [Coniochaeta sp. 2T2.1]|nr:hypothetical protein GE09DRAFT_1050002 [Coniochaeta sp. 2T2.1]